MITEEKLKLWKPVQAVIVFKKDKEDFYLQTHDIVDNKYTEGKPFNQEQLKELALALNSKGAQMTELRGLLPDRILYYQPSIGGTRMIWFVPKAKRSLNFRVSVKIKSGVYQVPSMIFAVNDKTLTVWACKGTAKPTIDTKIFHAPFWNTSDTGVVCMGTTTDSAKKHFVEDEMERHERRFFGSNFTHSPSKLAKGWTMKKVYTQKNSKRFPERCLHPARFKNLGAFVNSFLKGKGGNYED